MENVVTGFAIPEDGWFHIATPGEWPHKATGLVQVIDTEAMQHIVDAFSESTKQPNWPGVLIDFDHQSLDQDKPTVAAGWIVELDQRDSGIWAKIKWSDIGRQSIEGGRYRFISPVWRSSDCAKLDGDKIRPLKLMNCAVTNDPNIKGMFPLSNSHDKSPAFSAPAMPLENRMRSREEEKAIFAKMGGGAAGLMGGNVNVSGGGAATPRPAPPPPPPPPAVAPPQPELPPAPAEPAQQIPPTPAERPMSPAIQEYERRIAELNDLKAQLEANRPARPEPLRPLDKIDVRAVMAEAMRQPGVTSTEVLEARKAAEEENRSRKAELRQLKRDIRRQYPNNQTAQDRAIKRALDSRDAQSAAEMREFHRDNAKVDALLSRIDREIHATEVKKAREYDRVDDRQTRAERTADSDAVKARQLAVREQINADKEAERQRQVEARKAREADTQQRREASDAAKAATQPVRDYRSTITARRTFWDAVERKDYSYAKRIRPDADIEAAKQAVKTVNQSVQGKNATERNKAWTELRTLEPPSGTPSDERITEI
jgi:hypothetical protein